MRKFQNFAFAGAIALAGAAGLTACSSDDAAEAPINPTFDGESVKTAFTINIPGATRTRMSDTETQAGGTFQGMKDIYLFSFAKSSGDVAGTDLLDKNVINLSNITSFNTATSGSVNSNKKRYDNVSFDIGVSNFLFYATSNLANQQGALIPYYKTNALQKSDEVSKITFSLSPCYTENPTAENGVLNALNAVAGAFNGISNLSSYSKLNDLFKAFIYEKADGSFGAWAGSSTSVFVALNTLRSSLEARKLATGTTEQEKTAITTVITAIENYIANGSSGWAWKIDPNFPKVAGLPDGAVAVRYDGTNNKFSYVQDVVVNGMAITKRANYTKPAALYYFVNSPAMTSTTEHKDKLENTTDTWDKIAVSSVYEGTKVEANTQSVIIKKPIQYGVADLKSRVYILNNVELKDSKGQTVTAPQAGYKVTGILVGGQKNVDWKFETTTEASATEYTLYDGNIANNLVAKTTQENNWNHTLVLETAENATTAYNVAVELENTGNDFYGSDGQLIPAGTKFYLVGQLKPADASNYSDLTSVINKDKLFQQDVTTVVTFKIGAETLKSAYNVIPDLRSPKLEFGLSVDLNWQSGLTFDVELK